MPAKKRKTVKRAKAKKTAARKAAPKAAPKKTAKKKVVLVTTPIRTALNKSQLLTHLSEVTELSRKEIATVFEALQNAMHRHLRKGATGEFTMPGLFKCIVKHKPATKARKGVNPFTGEMITFKAKPARDIIKVRALKRLKEMTE